MNTCVLEDKECVSLSLQILTIKLIGFTISKDRILDKFAYGLKNER